MRYQKDSNDLRYIRFDSGEVLNGHGDSALKDDLRKFRETFECAAKYGMKVDYCISTDGKTITMVNLHPCGCPCKRD